MDKSARMWHTNESNSVSEWKHYSTSKLIDRVGNKVNNNVQQWFALSSQIIFLNMLSTSEKAI